LGLSASGDQGKKGGSGYTLYWAVTQGESDRKIADILKEILGHETTRSSRVSEMKIKTVANPRFLVVQDVHFEVHPFPLVHINWNENWAVSLLKGDAENPEKIWVTYEKTSGTSYIQHLCGQFELTSEPNGKTLIVIYEQAAAKGRTEQDTLSGISSTLRALQKKAN
jgi:hypothetical protein